jgi:YD repeat-containing protein
VSDALGRLVRVDEPDKSSGNLDDAGGSPVQPTSYFYDALGNLRRVDQGGQYRFFMYDSLSRLIRAKNPEQGALSADADFPALTDSTSGVSNGQWSLAYNYDASGNLIDRKDARGVVTAYGYDALNRPTTVRYADSVLGPSNHTKDVDRHYDGATNGRGRFNYFDWDQSGNNSRFDSHLSVDQYDAVGRPLACTQHFFTNGVASSPFTVQRAYDLAGHVLTETYPSGHAVSYSYDSAGRLADSGAQLAFSGNLGDSVQRTYSSQVTYDQSGGMSQERFGTDTPLYHKLLYNSRAQLAEIRVGTAALPDTGWQRGAIINLYSSSGRGAASSGHDNNENLREQDIFVPNIDGPGYDQGGNWTGATESFSYDYLNRLTSATESSANPWAQSYTYDRWGNRTINQSGTSNAPALQFGVDTATNRLTPPAGYAMNYDAAGNLINDNYSGYGSAAGQQTRFYDAEGRMTSAQINSSQSAAYTYDADGQRVKRNAGGAEVWQVYGMGGELLAEYASGASPASPQKEYSYRGGQLLVTAAVTGGWGAAPTFDDNPLVSRQTVVQSKHITQLRSAIDSLRSHLGMSAYSWQADASVGALIKADPILEMRTALDQALGAPGGGYSAGLAQEQPILAVHIQELRDRVLNAWQGGSVGADVRWLVTDQLGTPRMVIDRTGSLAGVSRHDYLPFGEEVSADDTWRSSRGYGAADAARQRFTGQERDDETSLDYMLARYYCGPQGGEHYTDEARIFSEPRHASGG